MNHLKYHHTPYKGRFLGLIDEFPDHFNCRTEAGHWFLSAFIVFHQPQVSRRPDPQSSDLSYQGACVVWWTSTHTGYRFGVCSPTSRFDQKVSIVAQCSSLPTQKKINMLSPTRMHNLSSWGIKSATPSEQYIYIICICIFGSISVHTVHDSTCTEMLAYIDVWPVWHMEIRWKYAPLPQL